VTAERGDRIAWVAHLYTASGLILGFLALLAVSAQDFRAAFLWLFAAVLVDATDGWLARRLRVEERLPSFNGARLDDIVDYVTYVFVPAYLLYRAATLPESMALATIGAMLLSSAYAFAREDAKTADHFFTGFPSYWNIVAFYVYAAGLAAWINAVVLLAGCALIFVRTTYVYPSRMPALRAVTIGLGAVWGAALLWLIRALPTRYPHLLRLSLLFPAYYVVVSLILHGRRRRRTP
jgi:phosphatidylcholine synthase